MMNEANLWKIGNHQLANLRATWPISAYLASEFIDLPLYKAMMHVVGDKAWQ